MRLKAIMAVLAALLLPLSPAMAQGVGGNISLTATTSSARVAFPADRSRFPAVVLAPAFGAAQEIFYRLGDGTVVAATTSAALPSGGICLNVGPNADVAAITSTGTAVMRITQLSSCTFFSGGSGGGGGGGGGAITSPLGAGVSATAVSTVEASDSPLLLAVEAPLPTQAPTVSVGGVGIIDSAGTNVASVKAASTPPATTDKSVVVALNPNAPNSVVPTVGTTGGSTPSSAIAPATPAGVNIKASAGTLYGVQCTTIQATPVYVKIYNASSAPTCGSGTPVLRFMCPSASTPANGAGNNPSLPSVGVAMGTGLGYCVTGALADNDTTAITAANTLINIEWN